MRHFTILVLAVCAILLAGIGTATPLFAQPFTLDEKIKATELKLQPYRAGDGKADGRIYGAIITQTEATQYFYVEGVSIYSPNYVGITAENPSETLKVSLHKETWEQANVSGQTQNAGHWEAKFKTSGDFGIRVTSDHLPAQYALLVWVGNEVDAPPPSPFTRSATAGIGAAASSSTKLYVIIGLLILALVALAFFKFRPVRTCLLIGSLIFGLTLARPMRAQEGAYPKAVAEMLEQLKAFLEHQENVKDFWESLQALSSDEAVPDTSQRGPSLPSSCVDASWKIPPEDRAIGSSHSQDCQCMATAVDKLRKNRQMLEKLRIYVANQKAFVDKATTLGNSFAQLHTLLGLQWVGIKKHDIDEPYAQFKVISNQKHQALMDAIEKDLKDISVCEAKFGEPNWYDKYGFMYYEFLYAAYKPSF